MNKKTKNLTSTLHKKIKQESDWFRGEKSPEKVNNIVVASARDDT